MKNNAGFTNFLLAQYVMFASLLLLLFFCFFVDAFEVFRNSRCKDNESAQSVPPLSPVVRATFYACNCSVTLRNFVSFQLQMSCATKPKVE